MLTCQELTELITDYLEGRLDGAVRMRFQMHIALCRHCRCYLRQMRTVIDTASRLPPDPVPDEVMSHLVEGFQEWRK